MKVLIVKIGAIGDAVMALGAVQWVKSTYPDSRITWLAGEKIVPLLRTIEAIDHIVSVNEEALFGTSRFIALKTLLGVWRRLFGWKFDLAVLGHKDRRYRLLLLPTHRAETRMFGNTGERSSPVPGRYHGDEYLRLVSGSDDRTMPPFSFPAVTVPDLSSHLEQRLGPKKSPWILLVPGGAKNPLANDPLRRWPIQSYVALAKTLIANNYRVILAGGAHDLWVQDRFQDTGAINLIGRTGLEDLMALISRSDIVVAHDSGPLHLALLLKKPLVALFGPTDPKEKLPRQPATPVRLLWNGGSLPCSPRYDGKQFAPCDRNICMEMITVKETEAAIEQLLI